MHNKSSESHNETETGGAWVHPLKDISEGDFAALGGNEIAFVRPISAGELRELFPDAGIEGAEIEMRLVMSADGTPLLVTDTEEAVSEWMSANSVGRVTRH